MLFKLQLHDVIYRLQFCSNSLTHILSLSNLHSNIASIQKNRDNKSHRVIVALTSISQQRQNRVIMDFLSTKWFQLDTSITGKSDHLGFFRNQLIGFDFISYKQTRK